MSEINPSESITKARYQIDLLEIHLKHGQHVAVEECAQRTLGALDDIVSWCEAQGKVRND